MRTLFTIKRNQHTNNQTKYRIHTYEHTHTDTQTWITKKRERKKYLHWTVCTKWCIKCVFLCCSSMHFDCLIFALGSQNTADCDHIIMLNTYIHRNPFHGQFSVHMPMIHIVPSWNDTAALTAHNAHNTCISPLYKLESAVALCLACTQMPSYIESEPFSFAHDAICGMFCVAWSSFGHHLLAMFAPFFCDARWFLLHPLCMLALCRCVFLSRLHLLHQIVLNVVCVCVYKCNHCRTG